MSSEEVEATKAAFADALLANLARADVDGKWMRTKKLVRFKRALPDVVQEIDFHLNARPLGQPGALCFVNPRVNFFFPAVNGTASQMGLEDRFLPAREDVSFFAMYEWIKPGKGAAKWYIEQPCDVGKVAELVAIFTRDHVFPFLDEFKDLASLAGLAEKQDRRLGLQPHSYVYVAAAFLLCGQAEAARAVLERRLGKPGLRRQFRPAFDFVDRILQSGGPAPHA